MGSVRSVPLDSAPPGPPAPRPAESAADLPQGSRRRRFPGESLAADLTLTPKAGSSRSSRNKGRCVMMPDPTPPYDAHDFCPDCREKFLAVVGWIAPALEATLSPAAPEPIITPEDTLRA